MAPLIFIILIILVIYYFEKANREQNAGKIKEQENFEKNRILTEKLNQINHEKKILNFIDRIKLHQLKLIENSEIEEYKIRIKDFSKEFDYSYGHVVSKKTLFTYIKIKNENSYSLIKIIEKNLHFSEMEINYRFINYKTYEKIDFSIKIDDTTEKNEDDLWNFYIELLNNAENKNIIKKY